MLKIKDEIEVNGGEGFLRTPKVSKILVVLRNDVDYVKTVDYVINFANSMISPTVYLLYIANIEPILADESVEKEFYGKLREEGERVVKEAVDRLRSTGINVQLHGMYFGIAAERILKAEKELNPDLIVIGARGSSTFKKMIVGSVSDEVSKKTVTPILIVGSNTNHNGRG